MPRAPLDHYVFTYQVHLSPNFFSAISQNQNEIEWDANILDSQ